VILHLLPRSVPLHFFVLLCAGSACIDDVANPLPSLAQMREGELPPPEPLVEFVEDSHGYNIEHAVDMQWLAVPGPDASAYVLDGVARLKIENTSGRSIAPDFLVLGDMGGMNTSRIDVPSVTVAAGEAVELELDVRNLFSFDTSKQKYSGQVKLCASFKDELTRTPPKCSAAIYFHPEGEGLKLYGEGVLLDAYDGGDYKGILDEPTEEPGIVTTRIYDGGLK